MVTERPAMQEPQVAKAARALFFGTNVIVPLLDLRDGQARDKRTNFNYHSRHFDTR